MTATCLFARGSATYGLNFFAARSVTSGKSDTRLCLRRTIRSSRKVSLVCSACRWYAFSGGMHFIVQHDED